MNFDERITLTQYDKKMKEVLHRVDFRTDTFSRPELKMLVEMKLKDDNFTHGRIEISRQLWEMQSDGAGCVAKELVADEVMGYTIKTTIARAVRGTMEILKQFNIPE